MVRVGPYSQWQDGGRAPQGWGAFPVEGPSTDGGTYRGQEARDWILDPDVVVALGFLHGDLDELNRLRQDPEVDRKMRKRVEAMAEFTEEVIPTKESRRR